MPGLSRRIVYTAMLAIAAAVPVSAHTEVVGKQVLYLGGTARGLDEKTLGALNTTDEEKLVFEFPNGRLEIPYGRMQSVKYSEKLAHRLGVVATVAVVLVKHRARRHFIEIDYKDPEGKVHTAVFEVSKEAPTTLLPILGTRCPSCMPKQLQFRPPYPNPYSYPPPGRQTAPPAASSSVSAGSRP